MVVHVLTVSSKGQVVLPVSMRKAMEMESGSKLAAYATRGHHAQTITVPGEENFEIWLDEALDWAETSALRHRRWMTPLWRCARGGAHEDCCRR